MLMTWAVVSLVVSSLPLAATLSPQKSDGPKAPPAIEKAVAAFIDAFNRHDPHAVALTFTPDADFTSVRGVTVHGQKGIESFYAGVFAGRLKSARRSASVISSRPLAPGIVSVDATWEITGATADDGSAIPLRRGILTVILMEKDAQWFIAVYHELELPVTQ